jgi:hypothetical protein
MSTFSKPKAWRFTFSHQKQVYAVETTVAHPQGALQAARRVMALKHGLGGHEIQLIKSEKLSNG